MSQPRFFVEAVQESFTGIGAHWIVKERHGRCGCGSEDMTSRRALFSYKDDAALFCHMKNRQALDSANAKPAAQELPPEANSER